MKDYIGIFDSGIGGLSILEKVREIFSLEIYIIKIIKIFLMGIKVLKN